MRGNVSSPDTFAWNIKRCELLFILRWSFTLLSTYTTIFKHILRKDFIESSKSCFASGLSQPAELFTSQRLKANEFLVDAKVATLLFSNVEEQNVSTLGDKIPAQPASSSAVCSSQQILNAARKPTVVETDSPGVVAQDSEEENREVPLTAPPIMGRRLFHSPTPRMHGSAPSKRGRGASGSRPSRGNPRMLRFRATYHMDFNRAETCLFKFIFTAGLPENEVLVRMLQYGLSRRELSTLAPGQIIDGKVVQMVATRNAYSIQHLRNPFFWCLPPTFADDVSKGFDVDILAGTYLPFWIKPTRFVNRIFIPIEDIFMHWYCMVVDFGDKAVYHLDSYPDAGMIPSREGLMREILVKIFQVMTCERYGPFCVYTPKDLADWPIRRGQGIPNYNTSDSSAAWVISWLHPLGNFNGFDISGVLDDSTIRGKTAISLAGGPFNAIGDMVISWAEQWQKDFHKRVDTKLNNLPTFEFCIWCVHGRRRNVDQTVRQESECHRDSHLNGVSNEATPKEASVKDEQASWHDELNRNLWSIAVAVQTIASCMHTQGANVQPSHAAYVDHINPLGLGKRGEVEVNGGNTKKRQRSTMVAQGATPSATRRKLYNGTPCKVLDDLNMTLTMPIAIPDDDDLPVSAPNASTHDPSKTMQPNNDSRSDTITSGPLKYRALTTIHLKQVENEAPAARIVPENELPSPDVNTLISTHGQHFTSLGVTSLLGPGLVGIGDGRNPNNGATLLGLQSGGSWRPVEAQLGITPVVWWGYRTPTTYKVSNTQ
ncbi:hypothetical protein PIB30_014927 [Stylosanthes scabra]|uniref:Ubiquitin-like protease family profile domain-containing protein n=1 Tax=Stylosanthes scabra TaxID=79078 RepID=A0ABU6V7R9_9FABA|nr:hypothetical protein [Stylosanthes scabra]